MVSPCFVGVQAAIGPNLRFGEPMCVPAVLVFRVSDGLQKQPARGGGVLCLAIRAICQILSARHLD